MFFFWRRLLFILVTVYMFDYPLMQMFSHHLLSMVTMAILLHDQGSFESKAQRNVEVGSELCLHLASIVMSQFMNVSVDEEQKK